MRHDKKPNTVEWNDKFSYFPFNKAAFQSTKKTLAIDFGGVIVVHDRDLGREEGEDTYFGKEPQLMPGVITALQKLSKEYNLCILSFAGKTRALESIDFLKQHEINSIIPENQWIFVSNKYYKSLFMKKFNVFALIDDTQEVIDDVNSHGLRTIHFGQKINWYSNISNILKSLEYF